MDRAGWAAPRRPAAFRRRLAAAGVDYVVISGWIAIVVAIGVLVRAVAPGLADELFASRRSAQAAGFVTLTLPVGLYLMLSEASARRATIGKRVTGLLVTNAAGSRIRHGRSALRTAAKLAPWELSHTAIWWFALGGASATSGATLLLVVVWSLVGANVASTLLTGRALYDFLAGTYVRRPGTA